MYHCVQKYPMHHKWQEAIALGLHEKRPKLPDGWAQADCSQLLSDLRELPSAAQETALMKWRVPFEEWPKASEVPHIGGRPSFS